MVRLLDMHSANQWFERNQLLAWYCLSLATSVFGRFPNQHLRPALLVPSSWFCRAITKSSHVRLHQTGEKFLYRGDSGFTIRAMFGAGVVNLVVSGAMFTERRSIFMIETLDNFTRLLTLHQSVNVIPIAILFILITSSTTLSTGRII